MTLQTNPADRREMVRAISERLGSPAVYLRMPTCAYRIGGLTVESDGSIASDDEALLETLRPMLIERGWLTDAVDSEAEAPPAETELSFPVEDWAVPQLNNLIRVLYGNQHILRRMMRSDALYIDRQLVERLKEAQTPADFEARLAEGLAAGTLKGCRLREGKLAFETAPDDLDPARRQENEKYHANSLLTRLGFAGREHRELRRMLMGHLSGYAAFKNEAGMQAHREKYAQLRRERQAAKEGTET